MTRVAVFIDYQNAYMRGRAALELDQYVSVNGQIYPRRAGVLLTDRGRTNDSARELEVVRVYRGEPDERQPKAQAACQRQVRYWRSQERVEPFMRALQYHHLGRDKYGKDKWEAREKGIDVRLAVDMVRGAVDNLYDVCVLFSGDTDLEPAVEAVIDCGKKCEVVAWRGPNLRSPRLRLPNRNLWCHWLDTSDYGRIHDPTDYTQDVGTPPQSDP